MPIHHDVCLEPATGTETLSPNKSVLHRVVCHVFCPRKGKWLIQCVSRLVFPRKFWNCVSFSVFALHSLTKPSKQVSSTKERGVSGKPHFIPCNNPGTATEAEPTETVWQSSPVRGTPAPRALVCLQNVTPAVVDVEISACCSSHYQAWGTRGQRSLLGDLGCGPLCMPSPWPVRQRKMQSREGLLASPCAWEHGSSGPPYCPGGGEGDSAWTERPPGVCRVTASQPSHCFSKGQPKTRQNFQKFIGNTIQTD